MQPTKQKLSEKQIHDLLIELPEWALEDGKLARNWTLPTFVEAIAFVNRVARIAKRPSTTPTSTSDTTSSGLRWSRTTPAASPSETPAWRASSAPPSPPLPPEPPVPHPSHLRDTLLPERGSLPSFGQNRQIRGLWSMSVASLASRHGQSTVRAAFFAKSPPSGPSVIFFAPLTKILHPIYNQR